MRNASQTETSSMEQHNKQSPCSIGKFGHHSLESGEPNCGVGKHEMQMVLTKMEEKHTYTYKKLVVPMSMRSIYWKYFGFPATDDGDILTKVKIVCILCKTQIAYNRNTSNLRMHLQNKHAQELMDLESSNPPRKQLLSQETKDRRAQKRLPKANHPGTPSQHIYTTNADGTVQIDGDIQFVADPNINISNLEEEFGMEQPLRVIVKGGGSNLHNQNVAFLMPSTSAGSSDYNQQLHHSHSSIDGKTVSDAIAEFIILDLQIPEVVQGRGFQSLIATLSAPCEIPSKHKLEVEIIPRLYETYKEAIAENLSCVSSEVGLAIEEWRSISGEVFVTVSVYHQNNGDCSLDCKVLSSFHAPLDWDEPRWETIVDSLLLDWGLRVDKVTAVVVGTARPELLAALTNKGLALVPCLLYTLQICAQACFDHPDVSGILTKCRTMIGAINRYQDASSVLGIHERNLELEEGTMILDHPTVWTSTYNMLEQLTLRKDMVTHMLENMEGLEESIELTEDQWRVIEDLVTVLEPFKVTIITLSEEKMPLISLLKPLLWQLVSSHLKVKDSDTDTAKSFKESLSEMLCERYADGNVTLLLQIATTLDPRFKQLPYATEEDKNMVSGPIKEMLTKLIQEESGDAFEKIEDDPPCKKGRLSGMELLLGGLCTTKSGIPAEEKADLELVQYQSEAVAPLDYCPLQWWAKISAKCPNLGRLARRYNCVPACCAPPSRIPADKQVLYDIKRAALPPHLADKLLFLHGNHTQ